MAHRSVVSWRGDMAFEAEVDGHRFTIDADEQFGGKDQGPRPKKLLLSALAGCTGMDVVSILNKMRVPFESFRLEVEADMNKEHPKTYRNIRVKCIFTGSDLDRDKIEKAVSLSKEKYCSVTAMLEKSADISYEIILNT